MRFTCPSVPHNGHHLLRNRIMIRYHNLTPFDYENAKDEQAIVSGHFHFNELHRWEQIIYKYPAIIPLRHPARNLMSFQKRAKSYELWMFFWSTMICFDHMYVDPLFVHIDDPEIRDYEVDLIQQRAEIERHQIDWSVDRGETGSQYGLHDVEITNEIMKQVPDRFLKYYYEKMPSKLQEAV